MSKDFSSIVGSILTILAVPAIASAQTVASVLGLVNICAGLMVTAAIVLFVGGFIQYLALLGTERRAEGLHLMLWGVSILFVLVILLGVVNVLEGPIAFLIGIVVALIICFAIVLAVSKPKPKPPAEH